MSGWEERLAEYQGWGVHDKRQVWSIQTRILSSIFTFRNHNHKYTCISPPPCQASSKWAPSVDNFRPHHNLLWVISTMTKLPEEKTTFISRAFRSGTLKTAQFHLWKFAHNLPSPHRSTKTSDRPYGIKLLNLYLRICSIPLHRSKIPQLDGCIA